MKPEIRHFMSIVTAWMILAMGFYALVLYPFQLPDLVAGAFVSLMTLAANYVFADQLGASIARRQQAAFDSGAASETKKSDLDKAAS